MDISGIFKDLWRGNREYSLTPRQHDALPTTQPLTAPASTPSTRKEKTSMVQILRQRYRHHRGSKGHSSDDTTEVSISSSCAPSQLKLRFDGDQQENSSLADFFKNYDMPDVTPMSSTSGSSNSSSPKFRIASPNTSIQTLATSIGSLRSFQLGLTAAGLPIFRRAALSVGKIIPADVQTGPASQNCPTCGAQPESKNNIKPIPVCTSVEHDSRDVIEVIEIDDKPVPEAHPISSAIEVETSATCIPCTNGSTLTPCTDVTGVSEDGTALERHQWDMIERITDESLMQLLQKAINQKPTNDVSIDDCSIDLRFRGGYNCVVMMSAVVNRRIKQYVARIPAIGTQSRGRDGDAHNMRCEVSLMKYMHVGRVLPIPKIVAFSDTLDTAIGAPFILMKLLRGRPAQMIWYEEPGNRNYETTAKVTPKTEVKRRNFLCSLAFQMSKLEYLRFDKIGTPDFTETLVTGTKPKVTYAYRWKSPHETKPEDLDSDDQIYEYGPFESSEEYMTAGIDEAWPNTHSADFDDYPDTENMIFGTSLSPSSSATQIDFQNILTDDEGNVMGVIDWKGRTTTPRCAGYSAVPDFLRRYWVEGHEADTMPHMDWQVEKYAQIYTDAVREFSPKGAVYTRKSAMYDAIVRAVAEGNAIDLCQKLFKCIPAMRGTDADTFNQLIGKGCEEAEAFIKEELKKLLEPDQLAED